VLHTAISDLEVINEEEQGFLYHVRYPLIGAAVNGVTHLKIATPGRKQSSPMARSR
jgi:valyl-tRNA synthetase